MGGKLLVKIVKLAEVEPIKVLGGTIKRIFNQEIVDTKHLRFSVGDFSPGEGLKAHLHPESEEIYYIMSGRGTVYLGKEQRPLLVDPDTAIYIPPKMIHCVKNEGEERLALAFFVAPGREKSEII